MESQLMHTMDRSMPILLYDGECALCQAWVRFVLRHSNSLRVVSQHSASGRSLLANLGYDELPESIVLLDEGKLYSYSDAILQLSRHLRGPGKILRVLRLFPKPHRDAVYKWIANRRHLLFGNNRVCSFSDEITQSMKR